MAADVESARREWQDAYRRLEQEPERPAPRRSRSGRSSSVISDELRRRVGGRFTLRELAAEYRTVGGVGSRRRLPARASARLAPDALVIEGAAFHAYSRGAEDYEP